MGFDQFYFIARIKLDFRILTTQKSRKKSDKRNKVEPGDEKGKKGHRPLDTLKEDKQTNALSILYWN